MVPSLSSSGGACGNEFVGWVLLLVVAGRIWVAVG